MFGLDLARHDLPASARTFGNTKYTVRGKKHTAPCVDFAFVPRLQER
jgi:hypothetical protein